MNLRVLCVLVWLAASTVARAQQPQEPHRSLSGLLAPAPSAAQPLPELAEGERELARLSSRRDAALAGRALELGRAALGAAIAAQMAGRLELAERKLQLAWAELALASRQLAAAVAARERAAAERRASRAEAERQAADVALQQARARRPEAR
ncbi:MAG: hypothetical protein ACHQ53_09950 [Polyangiales bacterium]